MSETKTAPNFFYLLLDVKHPGYPAAITEYEKQHHLAWPENNLSVVLNVARTQALVKVDAGKLRPLWNAAACVAEAAVILRVFKFQEHAQVLDLLKTPDWATAEAMDPQHE